MNTYTACFRRWKVWITLILLCLVKMSVYGQMYILNEDFTTASGTQPPFGWLNSMVNGQAGDVWNFSNPGNRSLSFPITGTFAIFDAANYSSAGGSEEAILESPYFDATVSNHILLFFDQFLSASSGAQASVEVYNGSNWTTVAVYTTSNSSTLHTKIDISAVAGSISNAKVRFRWQGNSSGYWAIDNLRILSPLSLDAGISNLDSPVMPIPAGIHPIKVSLINYGYNALTSTTINWSVNGTLQTPYPWTGSLMYGDTMHAINIGSLSFLPGQKNRIKVWQSIPNGGVDQNLLNDTITLLLISRLCGTYTVGGTNPDFANFAEAAWALNNAGIYCPVTFKVRNGTYTEHIVLNQVDGNSAANTIKFESESGDSSKVILQYTNTDPNNDYTMILNGVDYLTINKISVKRTNGSRTIIIQNASDHIGFYNNYFTGNIFSSTTTYDTVLQFSFNNFNVCSLEINQPGPAAFSKLIVYRNIFSGGSGSLIRIAKNNDYTIDLNTFQLLSINNVGIVDVSDGQNGKITGNSFNNTTNYSKSTVINAKNETGLSIRANKIRVTANPGDTHNGIVVNTSTNVHISQNDLTNLQFVLASGITISGASSQIYIDSNSVKAFNIGIDAKSTGTLTYIRENKIHDQQGTGINAEGQVAEISYNQLKRVSNGVGISLTTTGCMVKNNFIEVAGVSANAGLRILSAATNNHIIFNTIHVIPNDPANTAALEVNSESPLELINNIFSNKTGGYAANFNISSLANISSDYNDFYSPGAFLIKKQLQLMPAIYNWMSLATQDFNSYSENPYFTSDTLPNINHGLLNNAGNPYPGISNDLMHLARNGATPDIGALEFNPCSIDAGINRITAPSNPLSTGLQPVKVELQNHGTVNLSSALIHWQVNGIAQTSFPWSGSLGYKANAEVQLGSYTFNGGTIYSIKAWTTNPNNSTDCDNYNDTALKTNLITPLCGIYTIGGSNPDFATFTEAASTLNTVGITCPVTFRVRNGTYNEHIILNEVAGNSSVNTITFESESGDSSLAVLNYNVTDLINNYNLIISGTDYLTFRKLGIKRTIGTNIIIQNQSHHIQFLNNILAGISKGNLTYDSVLTIKNNNFIAGQFISIAQPDTVQTSKIVIENNTFQLCSTNCGTPVVLDKTKGFSIRRNTAFSYYNVINLTACSYGSVVNNTIQKQSSGLISIYLLNSKAVEIDSNRIASTYNSTSGSGKAIDINNSFDIRVRKNAISYPNQLNSCYGIGLSGTCSSILIGNNSISRVAYGISLAANTSNVSIYDNTIRRADVNAIDLKGSAISCTSNRIFNNNGGLSIQVKVSNSKIANNYIQACNADPTGISVISGSTNNSIVFNSVNITSPDGMNAKCISISGGTGSIIENNIFNNAAGGYSFYSTVSAGSFTSDYNDLYSSGNKTGYTGSVNYPGLADWQAISNGDLHSIAVLPYFTNDTVLIPNHISINNAGLPIAGISTDIDGTFRNATTPDIGAKEISPCITDAGIEAITAPTSPVGTGNQSIKLMLRNHGNTTLSNVLIYYSVNGNVQAPYAFAGSLPPGLSTEVDAGQYNFTSINNKIRAWTNSPNSVADCDFINDTSQSQIYQPLCGVYTIGGVNPDFMTFTDAAYALNTVGISCAVVFKIRNGTYNEHVIINEVAGNSQLNTITFESQSGDSSQVLLQYILTNSAYDYTIILNGTDYMFFRHMGIKRVNGAMNIVFQNNSHNLTFEGNILGDMYSPSTSYDTIITITGNNLPLSSIEIGQPSAKFNSGILIEKNKLSDIYTYGSAAEPGISLLNTSGAVIHNNSIYVKANYPHGIVLNKTKNTDISDNTVSVYISGSGTCINSSKDTNLVCNNNILSITGNTNTSQTIANVQVQDGYIAKVSNSTLTNTLTAINTNGILLSGVNNVVKIFNDTLSGGSKGIRNIMTGNDISIHHTIIKDVKGIGISIETGSLKVYSNRLYNIENGTGISISSSNNEIYNNFIHLKGYSTAKGISILSSSGNKITFNSIHIQSIDLVNGRAIELLSCNTNVIKNNIFANTAGGYAAYVTCPTNTSLWDFNNYYSSGTIFGNYNGTNYGILNQWATVVSGDANSKNLNPFFAAPTELRPYQRQLNGAGIPLSGITNDIDNQIRNNVAPDIGADEFMVDFGITQITQPDNHCNMGPGDSITIWIRQFGDVPFLDLKVAYSVNNGTVYTDTIPGYQYNDLLYTFKHPFDFSAMGTYILKCWIIQTYDDNAGNDTITVTRYSYPAPVMNFNPAMACVGQSTQFSLSSQMPPPYYVSSQTWHFGDGDSSVLATPVHLYTSAGTYTVQLTAYSNIGCYNDTSVVLSIYIPPVAVFTADTVCQGFPTLFQNSSTIPTSEPLTYLWNYGDGLQSNSINAPHIFGSSGNFAVSLVVTAQNGCTDTLNVAVPVNALPALSAGTTLINCYGSNTGMAWVTAANTPGPYTYLWNTTSVNDSIFQEPSGLYSVTVSDLNGCISDTSVVITESDSIALIYSNIQNSCAAAANGFIKVQYSGGTLPYTYLWNTTATSDSIFNLIPGIYTLTLSDANGCIHIDSFEVYSFSYPGVTITATDLLCHEDLSGTATATVSGTPPFTFAWSSVPAQNTPTASGLSAGQYYVSVSNSFQCLTIDSIVIAQPPEFTLLINNQGNISCNGMANGHATVIAGGATPPYQYLWNTTPAITLPTIQNMGPGNYCITVTDSNSCDTSICILLTEPAMIQFQTVIQNEGCEGSCSGSVQLAPSGGSRPYSYSWNTIPVQSDSIAKQLCTGSYFATITDLHGCSISTDTSVVGTNTSIHAAFTASDTIGYAPVDIGFTFSGYGATTYAWDFGNGSNSTSPAPFAHYNDAGIYIVLLTINSGLPDNCTDTVSVRIILDGPSKIKVPNAFSPNNDGYNDVFRVESVSLSELDVIIMDRWGKKIFEFNTIDGFWDGNLSGQQAPDGVYYYILKAQGLDGKELTDQGSVTLVR